MLIFFLVAGSRVPGLVTLAATASASRPTTCLELAVGLRLIEQGLAISILRIYVVGWSQYFAFLREVDDPHPFALPDSTVELFVAHWGIRLLHPTLQVSLAGLQYFTPPLASMTGSMTCALSLYVLRCLRRSPHVEA